MNMWKLIPLAVLTLLIAVPGSAENWPRSIEAPNATVVIYQPQLETFENDDLTARAAVSVKLKEAEEPVFGAAWFAARIETDRDTHMVSLLEVSVSDVKFPEASEEQIASLKTLLETEIPTWDLTISLERLTAELDLVEKQQASENLETTPPEIIYATEPTVLVLLDGEAKLQQIEESPIMWVVNTPYYIFLHPENKAYYLRGGALWYTATDVMGPWELTDAPPKEILALTVDEEEDEVEDFEFAPKIIVRSTPAELIVSDGEATYSPVSGTGLLFMSNSDQDVFLDIDSQLSYVLLSGRWYSAASLSGEWRYVGEGQLPEDFSKIPVGSTKEAVRANVPGTIEAKDAVHNTYVPQTAAINREDASVEVEYDGDPDFEPIENTEMSYAVNTPNSVLQVGDLYYCCHEAVWYSSSSPNGPWVVCTSVPQTIYTIPPSCPHYHVRYVYIYDYTPEVVYVGYTPGYVGCYAYRGAVFYGTGYYYRGWYGRYYYPRPTTFGFAVRYNPITNSWGFAAGFRGPNGWIGFGRSSWSGNWYGAGGGWYGGGWWGAGGYRDINININHNRLRIDNRANIYNRRHNIDRNFGQRPGRPGGPGANRPGGKPGRPSTLPERPGNRPGAPGAGKPGTRPSGPGRPTTRPSGPGRPTTRPSTPTTRPSTPTTRPSTPTTRPSTPTTRPSTPTTRPSTPTTRPSTPTTRPSTPTTRPSTPTTRPSTPTTRPSTPTTRPSTPTTRPSTPTTRPSTPTTRPSTPTTRPATPTTRNNVYTDRSGSVYRNSGSNWQQRSSGGWSSGKSPSPSTRNNLNRQSQSRQRGTLNTNRYQRSTGSSSRSRGSSSRSIGSRSSSRGRSSGGRSFGGGRGRR